MPNVFDQFDQAQASGNVFDQFDDPAAPVGIVDAGVRGARGKFASGMQRLGNIATLPVIGVEALANQFRDKPDFAMSDFAMGKFVTPWQQMAQADAVKQGEDFGIGATIANVVGSLAGMMAGSPESMMPVGQATNALKLVPSITPLQQAGNVIGREFVQAQPLAQTNMIGRSNDLQSQGVPQNVANAATLHSYGTTDAAGFALPLSVAGGLAGRALSGAAGGVTTEIPSVVMENQVLNAMGQGQHAQSPVDPANLLTSGGLGAVLAMALGQRAPRMQTAESVEAGRRLDADQQVATMQDAIVPDSGLSVADIIQQQTGARDVPASPAEWQAQQQADAQARKERGIELAQTFRNVPPADEYPGARPTPASQEQAVRQDYLDAGEDPESVANAFARARQFGQDAPDGNTSRSLKGEMTPEQVDIIKQYTGADDAEIAGMSEMGKRKLLARAMEAQAADAERQPLVTSYGEDMRSDPISQPNVPGDRMAMPGELDESGRRITGDAREAGAGADVAPEVARKATAAKAKMLDKLDMLRQQKDALDENEVRRELKRKADMGLTMTDAERKSHAAWTVQREKLSKSIFDLEGKIYATEARSEQGSKAASGTSDRPFRMDQPEPGSFEEAARPKAEADARAKAAADEQAAIDRMEAEWRERQRMRRQEEAQQQAGQRKQESQQEQQAQQKYAGKKGTTREAPLEGGKFTADESGFVMSDNGSPLQFGHQRDAGWWILKRGNKGNTGQVFEIANHPSGKGYTVRVTMDNGSGNARDSSVGSGPGGSGAVPGAVVARGAGNRGAIEPGRGEINPAGPDGRPGKTGPVPDEGVGARAVDEAPEVVAEVRRMADNAGLAEQGGRIIRKSEDPSSPDYSEVVGRTKHIPKEDWWLNRPHDMRVGKRGKESKRFRHSEAEVKAAAQAWAEGKPLTAKQREIVDFLRDIAKQRLDEQKAALESQNNLDNLPSGDKIGDVPRPFLERIEVDTDVYDAETGKWSREPTNARAALDAVNEDVAMYRKLIDCLGR